MQRSDLTERIERDALSLRRRRLICELLRREGILAFNSRFVMDLADNLLKSLTHRDHRPIP